VGKRRPRKVTTEKLAIRVAWDALAQDPAEEKCRFDWVDDLGTVYKVVFGCGPKHPVLSTGITPGLWRVYVDKRTGDSKVDLPM
jgi:hypothetical protein